MFFWGSYSLVSDIWAQNMECKSQPDIIDLQVLAYEKYSWWWSHVSLALYKYLVCDCTYPKVL